MTEEFGGIGRHYCKYKEFTSAKCPKLNDVAEGAPGVIQDTVLVARMQAPILFLLV